MLEGLFSMLWLVYILQLCNCMWCDVLQILYAKDTDQRSTTFEKSFTMGQEYQRRTKALILRAAVLKNQINVKVCLFLYYFV